MRNLSWKAAAWTGGAIIVAGGVGAGAYAAVARRVARPAAARRRAPARPAPPPPPLRLLSVSPAAGSRGVDGADSIAVTCTMPLPASAGCRAGVRRRGA